MKKKHLIIIIVIALAVLMLLSSILTFIHKRSENPTYPYIEDYSSTLYTEGEYIHKIGGEEATKFFPRHEDLGDYANLEFAYCEIDLFFAPCRFYNFKSAFQLTVSYDNEQDYLMQKEIALLHCKKILPNEYFGYTIGGIPQTTDYPDIVPLVFYNDEKQSVRYLFYYKTRYDGEGAWTGEGRLNWDYPFPRNE